jgi:hypothetical protein
MCLFSISSTIGAGANVYAQSSGYHQTYGYPGYRQTYVYPQTYGYPRYHNPQAGKKKAIKRIAVGSAVGLAAGGLIGGGGGALVGGLLGAGGGTLFHFHKKHQYERHHRYYYYNY